jgi:hypothetical protein
VAFTFPTKQHLKRRLSNLLNIYLQPVINDHHFFQHVFIIFFCDCSYKSIDSKFSTRDAFLESPSSGTSGVARIGMIWKLIFGEGSGASMQ